tara:strand:+ start:963 stop:1298 length:336 start_codon:yes stop_codon:yes gene_type:complete
MLKPLAQTIVQKIIDKDGFYSIEAEGEEYQEITNDISLVCNQKDEDKYVGVDNLEWCFINFYDSKKKFKGWIEWIEDNNRDERVSDYSINLEEYIDLNKVIDEWSKEYSRL